MLVYQFGDMLDLSSSDHYSLAQILDNMTDEDDPEEFNEYFSLGIEG